MKRLGGLGRKTRTKLKKSTRAKGKISLSKYFQTFEIGAKIQLTIEPSVRHGIYDPKYIGKGGIVRAKNGTCYEVEIKDFKKQKTLIVHPIHMKLISEVKNA